MVDMVNHPPHYQTEIGLEAIEVIEAFFPGNYHLGNAFKYLARAGIKTSDPVEDLEKAIWYIQRFLDTQVRYTITEKGRAFAKLREAGFKPPLAKRIAYKPLVGELIELNDDGTWGASHDYTTENIIDEMELCGESLVSLDEEEYCLKPF